MRPAAFCAAGSSSRSSTTSGRRTRTIANVKEALANPQYRGHDRPVRHDRAKAAFDAVGSDIGASGIPFLSDITVNSIFEKQANVFTMRPSQDDERVPVMAAFIKARDIQRPAFVGLKGQLFSTSLGDGLKSVGDGASLVADHRLDLAEQQARSGRDRRGGRRPQAEGRRSGDPRHRRRADAARCWLHSSPPV